MEAISVLQNTTGDDFEANLAALIRAYEAAPGDLVLAPEVCLTGFCYNRMEAAAAFAPEAEKRLQEVVGERALVLTLIEKQNGGYANVAKVFHRGRVIHRQAKHKLFLLGDEHKHFVSGDEEEMVRFELMGKSVALLICFELRFPHLWQRIEGAEIILVPAMWGKNRAEHLRILSTALAVANRAYVAVADSANDDMAKNSAIITPWGERTEDNTQTIITAPFNGREITKMKRAIPYE